MPEELKKVCGECQQPAISMCPYCRMFVHHDFGYNGLACSQKHEARCSGARWSREPEKKPLKGVIDERVTPVVMTYGAIEIRVGEIQAETRTNGNGKHAKPVQRRKNGRR
jgi:hypothetical protein